MNRICLLATRGLLLLVVFSAFDACAYNEGGHYYTLLAAYENTAKLATPQRLQEIRLETFCAELPDLAGELDAITQRMRVLTSHRDLLWGALGRCQTDVSAHMVATQYYLHGLSGTAAQQTRAAAKSVIASIDADLRKRTLSPKERLNLICARGFADHLYGDTFAHVRLSSERKGLFGAEPQPHMYATGLGHARDGHYPDYLYAHNVAINQWWQWARDAGNVIAADANAAQAENILRPCISNSIGNCEKEGQQKLLKATPATPPIAVSNMQDMLANDNHGLGNMERTSSCDSMLTTAFKGAQEVPACNDVWKTFLARAIPVFHQHGIDPVARTDSALDSSCSAWRCKGDTAYGGEAPGSACAPEITDQLQDGKAAP